MESYPGVPNPELVREAEQFRAYHLIHEEPEGYYKNAKLCRDAGVGTWCRANFDDTETSDVVLYYFAGGKQVAKLYWSDLEQELELYEVKTFDDEEDMPLIKKGPLVQMLRFTRDRYAILFSYVSD